MAVSGYSLLILFVASSTSPEASVIKGGTESCVIVRAGDAELKLFAKSARTPPPNFEDAR